MTNRDYNPNDLEREATQNMPTVPRKIHNMAGFKVLPGHRIWEDEQIVNGEKVKVRVKVQSLDLADRADDQGALEPGDVGENYDSELPSMSEFDYGPNRYGATYLIPKRRG